MAHLKRRRVAVLGDMLELGRAATALHKRVGQLARKSVDLLVSVGDLSRFYAGVHFGDRRAAIDYLGKNLVSGDAVLFKASRALEFEKIVEPVIEQLKGRGDR
jgi:UDP-N-acetylmuramoyl-tripeptide--D-alanyl-D-alanine ligase